MFSRSGYSVYVVLLWPSMSHQISQLILPLGQINFIPKAATAASTLIPVLSLKTFIHKTLQLRFLLNRTTFHWNFYCRNIFLIFYLKKFLIFCKRLQNLHTYWTKKVFLLLNKNWKFCNITWIYWNWIYFLYITS